MPYGYMGRILRLDLTSGEIKEQPLDDGLARAYIGGSGLAARILYDETSASTDPLGSENLLIFMTGPLTGTKVPTSGRHAVVAKSPLTGIWGESDAGGSWGVALKNAGYDGLIITGQASRPVYLWFHDQSVEIRDATRFWGLDTYEVDAHLKSVTDQKASVACIGPAGERQARIAAIMHDGKHARAAGRSGLGAVMGAKLLKGIVVKGSEKINVARPEKLRDSIKRLAPIIREKTQRYHDYGTSGGVVGNAVLADMPAQNWRKGEWIEGAEKISGQRMAETILTGRYYCESCIIGCGREVKIEKGPYAGVDGAGPEYETLAGLGSMCLVDDLEAIAMANELCNRYGIDTISTGSAIAFAMEAYERGLISKEDTGGIELIWGNAKAMIDMVHKIGRREGLGELLGEGVKRVAEEIGGIAPEFAIHVKGQELPYHDPRALSSLAVAYATYPRGACHRGNSHYLERFAIPELGYDEPLDRFATSGKGIMAAKAQDYFGLFNSLKLCHFISSSVAPTDILEWLNLVTGWDMDLEEFLRTGERASNLKRMYNLRCGLSRKDDVLPPRITTEKFDEGGSKNYLPHLGDMLDEYYKHRGWSKDGVPLPATLIALGLQQEVEDLPPPAIVNCRSRSEEHNSEIC
jgi:aldehyde:ferredoxin oxidoreductase